MKNKGFTLIEILVAVLIIGILAAIAVPKYQLVLDKTKFTEIKNLASDIKRAYIYYLTSTGNSVSEFSQLDYTLPPNFEERPQIHGGYKYSCADSGTVFCCVGPADYFDGSVTCGRTDGSFVYRTYVISIEGKLMEETKDRFFHYGTSRDTRYERLAKAVGFNQYWYVGFDPVMLESTRSQGSAFVYCKNCGGHLL